MLLKEKSKPLYIQLKEEIYGMIERGEFAAGERIPSERELCERHQVSRMTVRLALADAIRDGRLYSQQGKGTYVSVPKVEQRMTRITTFENTMLNMGLQPETLVQGYQVMAGDSRLTEVLALPAGANVFNLRLLGMGSSEPMVLYNSYFGYQLGRRLFEKAGEMAEKKKAFSSLDLYDCEGCPLPVSVRQHLEAVEADEWVSGLMNLKKGSTMMRITSVFYDRFGAPLEYRVASYRGDRYRFSVVRDLSGE